MRKYAKVKCPVCGHHISEAGMAYASHMRKHVRDGEAKELRYNNKTHYEPTGRASLFRI